MQEEVKKQTRESHAKSIEFDNLRVKYSSVEMEVYELKQIKMEITRYEEIVEQRDEEISELRMKCGSLETQLAAFASFELTLKEYENRISALNQEIELWKQRYSELDAHRMQQIDELKGRQTSITPDDIDQLKQRYDKEKEALRNEIERLRQQIVFLQSESDSWKTKYKDLELLYLDAQNKQKEMEARLSKLEHVIPTFP